MNGEKAGALLKYSRVQLYNPLDNVAVILHGGQRGGQCTRQKGWKERKEKRKCIVLGGSQARVI